MWKYNFILSTYHFSTIFQKDFHTFILSAWNTNLAYYSPSWLLFIKISSLRENILYAEQGDHNALQRRQERAED